MSRAPSVCSTPGCPNPAKGSGPCEDCRRRQRRASNRRRAGARQRGYDRRWEATRRAFLAKHPTCECSRCVKLQPKDRPPATDAHHRDELGPFGPHGHDEENLVALAHGHHSAITAGDQPAGWNA